ncbi:transcription elongation factor NusA [Ignicoccus islandicus DSM 13165]|uniref:Transcription elongation factor NusA n=1 Tax=Ignicoccus islandicus DSM 13165 TaxID=940295 RepID=A0A0U3FPT1_9CREN|nr:transcription elongation factor NusA [Ignicoccus islandicus DSM 13165]
MKIPLDTICVKTGILCPSCQRKVSSGLVKEYEVDIMRKLLDLEERIKELKDAEYVKSYDLGDLLVIVLKLPDWDKDVVRRIRQALSRELNRKVRVVVKGADPREMAAQLLIPLDVRGVNIVWTPDGTQKYVIRVDRKGKRWPAPKEELEKVLSELLDAPVEIRPQGHF